MSLDTYVAGIFLISMKIDVEATDGQRIFTPWHIRCRMDWETLLPAVPALVWWQIAKIGGRDQRASGSVMGHTDASHPLCTLQCVRAWWVKKQEETFSHVKSKSKSTTDEQKLEEGGCVCTRHLYNPEPHTQPDCGQQMLWLLLF